MADDNEFKLTFDHQCFLMDNYAILSPLNKQCGYDNFHAMGMETDVNVHDVITALTGRFGLNRLTKLRPSEQGILQPQVRIWRVFPGKADGSTIDKEDEFIFDSALNPSTIEAITAGSSSRAGGSGLKSFEWEFGGTNPAEAEAVIMVKMTLYFQNMSELKRGWGDTTDSNGFDGGTVAGTRPSFMELILLPPGMKTQTADSEYDPMFYKIKASVGWSVPPGLDDEELVRELRSTQLVMYLNLLTHEIKIKEDGSIEVDVEYVGSTETALETGQADVIFPYGSSQDAVVSEGGIFSDGDSRTVEDVDAEIAALEEAMEDNADAQSCAGGEDGELDERRSEMVDEMGELRDLKKTLTSDNRSQAYENFTKNLSAKIRHLDLDNGFLKEWEKNEMNQRVELTSDSTGGVATITIGDQGWFSNPQAEAESAEATDVSDDDIYFVYFGDIMELACKSFAPDAQSDPDNPVKGMKFITGPLQYTDPRHALSDPDGNPWAPGAYTPKVTTINLADVPISYTMFMKFWNDTVVDPERGSYPVRQFLKDVISKLIAPAINAGCFPNIPRQQVVVSTAMFTVATPGAAPTDIIGEMPGERPGIGQIADYIASQGAIAGEDLSGFTYIFLYMNTAAVGTGDEAADERRGIYHYKIGADRGLVKKIDFKKNDVKGMKEARQDESGAMSQLREMYNADVTMLGNNIYIPGMTVYLYPPPGLGHPSVCGSDANLLGLGGYYNVIKVRSKIRRGGQYDTSLDCIFAASTTEPCYEGAEPDCEAVSAATTPVEDSDPWGAIGDAWNAMWGDDDFDRGEAGVDVDAEDACSGKESTNEFSSWFSW